MKLMIKSIPHEHLTDRERGMVITEKGRRIGCIVAQGDGRWGAWTMRGKIGNYSSPIAAENAIRAAARSRKAKDAAS